MLDWKKTNDDAMKKDIVITTAIAFGMGGLMSAFALFAPSLPVRNYAAATSVYPAWTEVRWPFPMDEWGEGKAFHCGADECRAEISLYVRAKIGFCNCTTGVSDDDELDRLSDFSLMGDKPSVLGPGRSINVAWMKGRSRSYAVTHPFKTGQSALAIAFNDHCDAVVATVVVANHRPMVVEPSVIEFLNSHTIIRWIETTFGL
jgi:hypothetical protein